MEYILFYLARFEETALSILFRESGVAFFSSLSIHALAMALVVGVNIAVCLHVLISNQPSRPSSITRFYPLHWLGVVVIFVSGLALLAAYPAKALTNPVFYLKLVTLIAGLMIARYMQTNLDQIEIDATRISQAKTLATGALLLWLITLFAGRFLAYTHTILLAARYY